MRVIPKIFHTLKLLKTKRSFQFGWNILVGNHPRPFWNTDPLFQKLYKSVENYLLLDVCRAYVLYQFVQYAKKLDGQLAELGVYLGGSAKIIAETAPAKEVHLFDTFEGLPGGLHFEFMKKGDFKDNQFKQAKNLLQTNKNVDIHPGLFSETTKKLNVSTFAMVHLDADLESSIREGCYYFYPLLGPGGVILIDDYGSFTCPGVKKAADEFCRLNNNEVIYFPTGQGLIIKK